METAVQQERRIRFKPFELNLATRELCRNGLKVRLKGHPLEVLFLLLEQPGEVVSRDVLQKTLWPADTFGDFEHGLDVTMSRLREALGDRAEEPQFIETLPRVGYRFIGVVEIFGNGPDPLSSEARASSPAPVSERPAAAMKHRRWVLAGASALVLLLAVGAVWFLRRPLPTIRIASYTQITNDGQWKRIAGTDGSIVYLNLFSPNALGTVPVSGGRVTQLSIDLPTSKEFPNDNPQILSVSPDGFKLLMGSNWNPLSGRNLWIADAHGGETHYLATGVWATWSPDGGTVLYSTLHGDLYTVPCKGGEPRLLLASPAAPGAVLMVSSLAWSPDGSRIRFVRNERYWEISADGKNSHEILPGWHAANPKYYMGAGHWTPDGDFFLFVAGTSVPDSYQNVTAGQQIWALDERRGWLHPGHSEPFQLTTGATVWGSVGFVVSRDGRTVYATGFTWRGELVGYDAKTKEPAPDLGGISAEGVSFSKDGRYLVYVTYPQGAMWRANRDGSGRLQLTSPPHYPVSPVWSPDGTQIVFSDWSTVEHGVIYTISSQGGTPKRLLPGDKDWELSPDWSPDGKRIVFAQAPVAGGQQNWEFDVGVNNRIVELDTGKLSDLPPCPKSCGMPRWSPDGRHILATTFDNDLTLFDFRTNTWRLFNLKVGALHHTRWSHNGRFIYFGDFDYPDRFFKSSDPGIYRIPVTGGRVEKVVDLRGFRSTGTGGWWGLDPDDKPLLTREAGNFDIFALSLERK